jgi:hypothetical protein
MIDPKEKLNPKAIEEIFCKPLHAEFSKAFKDPLTNDEASIFASLYMAGEKFKVDPKDESPELFLFKVIQARIDCSFSTLFTMNDGAMLVLAMMAKRPGIVTMYLWYIAYLVKLEHTTPKRITLISLSEMFPWGFISDAILQKYWEIQKVPTEMHEKNPIKAGPDNLLDYASAGRSIVATESKEAHKDEN